jgi:hypothetical protein
LRNHAPECVVRRGRVGRRGLLRLHSNDARRAGGGHAPSVRDGRQIRDFRPRNAWQLRDDDALPARDARRHVCGAHARFCLSLYVPLKSAFAVMA